MENSPPGIQIIPAGALPGGKVLFSIVGANVGASRGAAELVGDIVARFSESAIFQNATIATAKIIAMNTLARELRDVCCDWGWDLGWT